MTFEIIEGPEVYVERINITGNVRSQDQILRRELPMHEGTSTRCRSASEPGSGS